MFRRCCTDVVLKRKKKHVIAFMHRFVCSVLSTVCFKRTEHRHTYFHQILNKPMKFVKDCNGGCEPEVEVDPKCRRTPTRKLDSVINSLLHKQGNKTSRRTNTKSDNNRKGIRGYTKNQERALRWNGEQE